MTKKAEKKVLKELVDHTLIDPLELTLILSKNGLLKQYQTECESNICIPTITEKEYNKILKKEK